MDFRRFAIGTLVGGVVLFALGYLIFELAFAAFYADNVGSASGVERDPQLMWAVILGTLAYAALITFAMQRQAGSMTVGNGLVIGAVVGFLLWGTTDFILYGITNLSNLTRTIVDPLLEAVRGGVTGGVVAAVLGRVPAARRIGA